MLWRLRIGATVATLGWLLMDDWNAYTLAALGFGACGLVILLSTILAGIETRVVRMRRMTERRR